MIFQVLKNHVAPSGNFNENNFPMISQNLKHHIASSGELDEIRHNKFAYDF